MSLVIFLSSDQYITLFCVFWDTLFVIHAADLLTLNSLTQH